MKNSIGLGLAISFALMSGCAAYKKPGTEAGPVTSAPSPSPSPMALPLDPARRFEFFAIPSERGESRPRVISGSETAAKCLVEDRKIVFLDPISLGGETPMYLALREGAGESQVVQAQYQSRRRDRLGDSEGAYDRSALSFDPERRVWFLSLKSLVGEKGWTEGVDQTFELNVDLSLANRGRLELTLILRLQVPIPAGQGASEVRALSLSAVPDELALHQRRGGTSVAGGTLKNPLRAPAVFFLRAEETSPFRSEVTLWRRMIMRGFRGENYSWDRPSYPEVTTSTTFESQGALRVQKLVVHRQNGKIEDVRFQPRQWVQVPLDPEEQVQVSWNVLGMPGQPVCQVPPRSPAPDSGLEQVNEFMDYEWKVTRSRLVGSMKWEARLAEREIAVSEIIREELTAQSRPWVSITRFEPLSVDHGAGAGVRVGRLALDCQGSF